jgi:hypothetical protein
MLSQYRHSGCIRYRIPFTYLRTQTVKANFNLNFAFLLVFITTTSFTLLSGGCSIWLSNHNRLSSHQIRVFETCNTTWNMGIGAIFGLLGSKAAEFLTTTPQDPEQK